MPRQKKELTEAQAWREIAKAFAEPKPKKNVKDLWGYRTYSETELSLSGLCLAVDRLHEQERISSVTLDDMLNRINDAMIDANITRSYIFEKRGSYGWLVNDKSTKARNARCMIALWFALEAEHGE